MASVQAFKRSDAAAEDFHLRPGAAYAIDLGVVVSDSGSDLDGDRHASGAGPDLGAER
ncbi:MAG: hypothetical protein HY791_31350 [Deltaproteobacteria bacterium]|nr:hypothetical protein [Deltaproteobacteria bacterium]